ncbi:MAG: calcium/sodium antiporter [archaeon]
MLEYIINFIVFAVGLFILIKASDIFVDNVSIFAKSIGISEFIIGLTLVAFGTSMPELVSSLIASIKGSTQLVVGNLVGSNIANIGLILGITGLISVIKIEDGIIKRDGYLMLFSTALFYIFTVSHQLSQVEAGMLIIMYLVYLIFLFKEKTLFETDFFEDYLNFFIKFQFLNVLHKMNKKNNNNHPKIAFKELFISILSLIFVVLGANIIVDKSIWLAKAIGVTEGFIGLTIVALGTSLPELSISIVAAKKGQGDIALGNILGSNIVNIMFILGVSALITPIQFTKFTTFFVAPFLLFLSFLLIVFIARKNKLQKWQSAALLGFYILFIIVSSINQVIQLIK